MMSKDEEGSEFSALLDGVELQQPRQQPPSVFPNTKSSSKDVKKKRVVIMDETGYRKRQKAHCALAIGIGLVVMLGIAGCNGFARGMGPNSSMSGTAASGTGQDYVCPGSPAMVHASCRVKVQVDASCKDAMEEAEGRVNAQGKSWDDPHNKGTYSVLGKDKDSQSTVIHLQRVTGNAKYTDKLDLQFISTDDGKCVIKGCSQSQVTSVGDFSTNYCNMHNLYCGSHSDPKCKTVKHDFQSNEVDILPSIGATKSVQACSTL